MMFNSRKLKEIYEISPRNFLRYYPPLYQPITPTSDNALEILRELLGSICLNSNYKLYYTLKDTTVDAWRRWMTLITDPAKLPKFVLLVILTIERELNFLIGRDYTYLVDHSLVHYVFRKTTVVIEIRIHYIHDSSISLPILIVADSLTSNPANKTHQFHLRTIISLTDDEIPVSDFKYLREEEDL